MESEPSRRPNHHDAHDEAGAPAAPDAASSDTSAAGTRTCPVHPEQVSVGPDGCPKCGAGLEPGATPEGSAEEDAELRELMRRLAVAAACAAPLLLISLVDLLPGRPLSASLGATVRGWIELLLSLPACLWAGWPLYARGMGSLHRQGPNAYTLIALGVSLAFLFSARAVLFPWVVPASFRDSDGQAALHFFSAALIITVVLASRILELRAHRRTGAALRRLRSAAPTSALRALNDGGAEVLPLEDVVPGDLLRVAPGQKVPADGTLLEGRGAVDESMVSGGPAAVSKDKGEALIAGSVNTDRPLLMRAEKVGAETLLSRIVALVSEAQESRAPTQGTADKLAALLIPAVVGVATATFVGWSLMGPDLPLAHALANAIAVLVVACPCAFVLAAQLSVAVAMGRGAGLGVLFHDAEAVELLREVDTVVVDKTGTLTEGRPTVSMTVPARGVDEAGLLRLAATLEVASQHPLANSIVAAARERGIVLGNAARVNTDPGRGVRGLVDGSPAALGSCRLMNEVGIDVTPLKRAADTLGADGHTAVFVAASGRLAGLIAVEDPVREGTEEAIAALHEEGLRVVMVTGDTRASAESIAQRLAIDEVVAEALPWQKAETVAALQDRDAVVAACGDGINDAPALTQADVGFAIGAGTGAAPAPLWKCFPTASGGTSRA